MTAQVHMPLPFAADMLETLRSVEWSGLHWADYEHQHQMTYACPYCNALQSSGEHEPDCRLAAGINRAIAEMNGRTA